MHKDQWKNVFVMLKSLSSLTTLFDFGPSIISEKIKDQMRSLQFHVKNMFASRYVPGAVGLPRFSVLEVAASGVSGDVVSAPSSTNWICKRVTVVSKKSTTCQCLYIHKRVWEYLWLAYKYPMVLLTGEISFTLHSPIILAFSFL